MTYFEREVWPGNSFGRRDSGMDITAISTEWPSAASACICICGIGCSTRSFERSLASTHTNPGAGRTRPSPSTTKFRAFKSGFSLTLELVGSLGSVQM